MTDRTLDQLLDAWMDLGPTAAPARVTEAARLEIRATRQSVTPSWWPPRRIRLMNITAKFVAMAAAVIIAVFLGFTYLIGPDVGTPGLSDPTPTASASSPASPVVAPSLPALNLPGTRASPAGVYGWTFRPYRGRTGMHWVIEDGAPREVAAMFFDQGPDCLGTGGRGATPVRIAGLDGVMVEQYSPAVLFGPPDGDELTRAYALDVQDRTLCVFVTWHRTTTDAELRIVLDIVETIQAVPFDAEGIRFIFSLPEGWDTG